MKVTLSASLEHSLLTAWLTKGNVNARDRLIATFMPLVDEAVHRHKRYAASQSSRDLPVSRFGLSVADLRMAGVTGLMVAINRYKLHLRTRLADYAATWIQTEIRKEIIENAGAASHPKGSDHRNAFFRRTAIDKVIELLPNDVADPVEETASILKMKRAVIERALEIPSGDASLNSPFPDSDNEPIDLLADEQDEEDRITAIDQARLRPRLEYALGHLDARSAAVIQRRYLKDSPDSLDLIGNDLGISGEAVRQIEAAALATMRNSLSETQTIPLSETA